MDLYVELLASTIRMSVPLILACIAGLWSERAGIVDIGLEGKMLIASFMAASASAVFGSAWIGLACAILVSVGFALVHGYASINQRGNQVVSGVAINMLAAGLAVVLGNEWFREGGRTPALPPEGRFLPFQFPVLEEMPVIGPLVKVFLEHSILAYAAFALVPLTASNSSLPSSISASSTPQVKAPCEPPPCKARLMRLVSVIRLSSARAGRYAQL